MDLVDDLGADVYECVQHCAEPNKNLDLVNSNVVW